MAGLYSPDERIELLRTKVMLLGWKPWSRGTMWYVDAPDEHPGHLNPVERKQMDKGKHCSFPSEEEALKAVLDYYALQYEVSP